MAFDPLYCPETVRLTRRALCMTREQFATVLGVDESTIACWEFPNAPLSEWHTKAIITLLFAIQRGAIIDPCRELAAIEIEIMGLGLPHVKSFRKVAGYSA